MSINNFMKELSKNMYLPKEEYNNIVKLLNLYEKDNITLEEYIKNNYNKIFENWKKEYYMFNIPGAILSIKVNDIEKHIEINNDIDTIFDIASITKLYTEYILLKIIDNKDYNISLDTKITDLVNIYPNLDSNFKIIDLISFGNTYNTLEDIRTSKNKEEALIRLRTAKIIEEKRGYYLYTDIPIMILTDILETYTKKTYKELFDKYIIEDLKLYDTHLILSEKDKLKYMGYDKNTVNDPKANIMGGFYGHAGVKVTSKDLISFISNFYNSFSKEMIDIINKKSNTKNIDYDINGYKTEDIKNINNHMQTKNRALIGNFNIAVDKTIINDFIPSTLASDSMSKIGFAVQGSTRVHAETSIIYMNNKEYKTSTSLLLDIVNEYNEAKEYEKITGKIITKEGENDYTNKHYTLDPRTLLPYNGIYKELVNLIARGRILLIYSDYKKLQKN